MTRPVGQLDMFSLEHMLFGGKGGGGQMGLLSSDNSSGPNRGLNAMQKRALQLKKWQEHEDNIAKQGSTTPSSDDKTKSLESSTPNHNNNKKKIRSTKVRFSNDTLFLAACAHGDVEECKKLLADGTDIDCTNVDGMTAMHQACIDGNLDVVRFLIDNGANINAVDNDGWTPVHAAANCGHVEVTEALLDAGADPRAVNTDGELAPDIAETEEVEELIQKRLQELHPSNDLEELRKQELTVMTNDLNTWIKKGKVDDKPHPRTGATFLHVAASKGYDSIVKTLLTNPTLRSQVNVDSLDNEKWTPLAAACYFNQPAIVEILLENGADSSFKTTSGQSLDDLSSGHEDVIKLIEGHRKKMKELEEKREKERLQRLALNKEHPKLDLLKTPLLSSTPPIPPSPSSAVTTPSTAGTESETQRKAHAKRVRETRRSTQGISADDVSKAKDQIQKQVIQQSLTSPPGDTTTTTTTTQPLSSSTSTSSSSSSNNGSVDNDKNSIKTSNGITPHHQHLQEASSSSSSGTTKITTTTPPTSRVTSATTTCTLNNSSESKDLHHLPLTTTSSSSNLSYRSRPSSSRTSLKSEPDSGIASTSSGTSDGSTSTTKSTTTGSTTTPTSSSSSLSATSSAESKSEYQKLYEELLQQHELLKKETVQKEMDWNREKRQMQRKISELEEEVKAMDLLKSDNQRLKDENGALIRVISKLSSK